MAKLATTLMLTLTLLLVGTGCGIEVKADARHDKDSIFPVKLVGFTENGGMTSLELFDAQKNEFSTIKEYPLFPLAEECTVTADEGTIAYTQWDETRTHRKLIIEDINSGEVKEYYDVKGVSANTPRFFNGGKQLVFGKTVMKDAFPVENIFILDIESGEEKAVAEGFNIVTVKIDDAGQKTYGIEQDELDGLLNFYGGEHVSLDETGSGIFVKFSAPVLGDGGGSIYYSASLYRNAAVQGTGLVIASSIWRYDVANGESKLIYAAKDRRMVGRVSVSRADRKLVFVECFLITGEESSIMSLDLESGELETVIAPTADEYANLDPIFVSDNCFTYLSIKKGGAEKSATRYVYDLESGERSGWNITYDGKTALLRSFSLVN